MARRTPYWLIRAKALEGKIDRAMGVTGASSDGCPHCRRPILAGAPRVSGPAAAYHRGCWEILKRLLNGDMSMA